MHNQHTTSSETAQVLKAQLAGSYDGTLHFGQVVAALTAQGIESYRVDFRQGLVSYFLASGASLTLEAPIEQHEPVAEHFDLSQIKAAIAGAQQGVVKYPEFIKRVLRAGCLGYTVWIAGGHVSYWGRKGETHVEHFPASDR